jgi:hypothetical protein
MLVYFIILKVAQLSKKSFIVFACLDIYYDLVVCLRLPP